MVPYFGHHSCKMFFQSKPIRFGYKIWCLCGSDGYPYHFTIYTGKGENSSGPLGSRVFNVKVGVIAGLCDPLRHKLFFDNFFTSYNLLEDLASKNVKAIGTVRENGTLGASSKIKSLKEMKKSGSGTFDFRNDGVVYFCKWNDDPIVNIGSSFLCHLPTERVKC